MSRLALPMMIAQGGLMTMGAVDTFMIGRTSATEMGAVALGNGIASVLVVFGIGVVLGIEPLVAQAHGAGEVHRERYWLRQGLWAGGLMAIPLILLTVCCPLLLQFIDLSDGVKDATTRYLWARAPGIVFNCLYAAYRAYWTSVGRTRPILWAVGVANVINLGIDALLVLKLDLGAGGVGLATSGSWMIMLVIAAAGTWPISFRLQKPVRADLMRVLRLGIPIGAQISLEVGIFAATALAIARVGEIELAAHQVAIALASVTFMAGVGIAVAGTARVGFHIGQGHPERARQSGLIAIALGGCFMSSTGLIFFFFAESIAQVFAASEPEVVRRAAGLLRIAAVFSLCDGIQVVASGVLRGAGDTKWPFFANLVAHWCIGLPVALYLGYTLNMQSAGFWWGLTVGLTGVAITLLLRFMVLSRRHLVRLEAT